MNQEQYSCWRMNKRTSKFVKCLLARRMKGNVLQKLLQVTSSVLVLILTLQKESSAAFEVYSLYCSHSLCLPDFGWVTVTSVFKCAAVNSLGILHILRHATIIWDDQHISHEGSSKEERLTYMHDFLFSSCFFCLLSVPTEEITVFL